MRGADLSMNNPCTGQPRFIPTCVGQTSIRNKTWLNAPGSSPHAWGRLQAFNADVQLFRFIPTCVGQTISACGQYFRERRFIPTCVGQTVLQRADQRIQLGSSPHAWGRRLQPAFPKRRKRFIPTCVGQTYTPCTGPGRGTVHPHMRGADAIMRCQVMS